MSFGYRLSLLCQIYFRLELTNDLLFGSMKHCSITRAFVLMGTAMVSGNLRSLFTIRESEDVVITPCENVSCIRIDVDYEALENDVDEGDGMLVRFGQDDLLYTVSKKALAGAHGKMLTLKVIL